VAAAVTPALAAASRDLASGWPSWSRVAFSDLLLSIAINLNRVQRDPRRDSRYRLERLNIAECCEDDGRIGEVENNPDARLVGSTADQFRAAYPDRLPVNQ
jgi:hypothetical protein